MNNELLPDEFSFAYFLLFWTPIRVKTQHIHLDLYMICLKGGLKRWIWQKIKEKVQCRPKRVYYLRRPTISAGTDTLLYLPPADLISQLSCLQEPWGSKSGLSRSVTLTYILWHISDVQPHATVSCNSMSHHREPAETLKQASISSTMPIPHNKAITLTLARTAGSAMLLQWLILKYMKG